MAALDLVVRSQPEARQEDRNHRAARQEDRNHRAVRQEDRNHRAHRNRRAVHPAGRSRLEVSQEDRRDRPGAGLLGDRNRRGVDSNRLVT